uniref:hypothetical protein n=1 Tax=Acetatifactor sp. TaxID=1872090 RepID=UPI00405638B1
MEFGIINLWNLILIVILLLPNIIYAIKVKDVVYQKIHMIVNILEQVGRFGSMLLMVLPLGMKEFGFSSVAGMCIYFICNMILITGYLVTWGLYFRKRTLVKAMILAFAPTLIFLITGITLRHWWLVVTAVIFGVTHSYITYLNNKNAPMDA